MTSYLAVIRGLAISVPFVILTPICMVASTRLARQGRRSAIYVAFIPVALAALAHVGNQFRAYFRTGMAVEPIGGPLVLTAKTNVANNTFGLVFERAEPQLGQDEVPGLEAHKLGALPPV